MYNYIIYNIYEAIYDYFVVNWNIHIYVHHRAVKNIFFNMYWTSFKLFVKKHSCTDIL